MKLDGGKTMDTKELAMTLYDTYCIAVGGKAHDGNPLPSSDEFFNDPNKKLQSDAWIKVADIAYVEVIARTM